MGETKNVQHFDQAFTRPMHDLSLEQEESMGAHFDFSSAASSPTQQREYDAAMSLNAQVNLPASKVAHQYQNSPVCRSLAPLSEAH